MDKLEGVEYTVKKSSNRRYQKWIMTEKMQNTFEKGTYKVVNEGETLTISKSIYLFAYLDKSVNVTVKYEFEKPETEGEYEENEAAKLEKSTLTYTLTEGKAISVEKLGAFSNERDERLKMKNDTAWGKYNKAYIQDAEITYTTDKVTNSPLTGTGITADGSLSYTVTFRYKIKRVKVRFNMPAGAIPSAIGEQKVYYGGKLNTTGFPELSYAESHWGEVKATLKHFTKNPIDYSADYSKDEPKFDHINHVFGEEEFEKDTLDLYPVWNKAVNVQIKLRIKGQKTHGDEYEKADGTETEYISSIKKNDGDKVKASDFLEYVKSKINGDIYNKDSMFFKHEGAEIGQADPVDVKLPNTVIEFYVKRQIRTITLDTDEEVDVSKVKGGTVKSGNKKIEYRHGYEFQEDETPTIADTEEDEFLGWLNGTNLYKFNNPNSVTENVTLTPKTQKAYATVNINLNGLRAEGLKYEDGSITGTPDSTWSKITFRVPKEKIKNSPYTLTNLRANDGELFYKESTQRQVRLTGYTGDTTINKTAQTHEVTAEYTEDPELYKGMYPQTRKEINGTVKEATQTYHLVYGTFNVITAYSKGKKYERIGSDYFLYELVETELFPACEDEQMWTKNTIDISIFHGNNIYDSSYVRQYLEKVVKAKIQASTIYMPKMKNKYTDEMGQTEFFAYAHTALQQQALKYKKITDYAAVVRSRYVAIRGINISIYEGGNFAELSYVNTRNSNLIGRINADGSITLTQDPHCAFGLRPAITF